MIAHKMIEQKHYGNIKFDFTEQDIVIITCKEEVEFNVIQIERENLKKIINILKQQLK